MSPTPAAWTTAAAATLRQEQKMTRPSPKPTTLSELLEAAHLPWRLHDAMNAGIEDAVNSTIVLYGHRGDDTGFFIRENAELVVAAVNRAPLYEELREACARLMVVWDDPRYLGGLERDYAMVHAMPDLRTILAKLQDAERSEAAEEVERD